MMGYSYMTWPFGMWLFNLLLPLALIALVVWLFVRSPGRTGPTESEPIRILKERYARGEISTEEYRKMKEELEKEGSSR